MGAEAAETEVSPRIVVWARREEAEAKAEAEVRCEIARLLLGVVAAAAAAASAARLGDGKSGDTAQSAARRRELG